MMNKANPTYIMKKKSAFVLTLALSLLLFMALSSCGEKTAASDTTEGERVTEAPASYTVSFESNGGTEYNSVLSNGQRVIMPIPERAGFTFDGWYVKEDFSGEAVSGEYLPSKDITFYAKWTEIDYITVTFRSNGGTKYDEINGNGEEISLPTPKKDGHLFKGWFDNQKCEGAPLGDSYTPTEDVYLYALWEALPENPVLTFNSLGGTKFVPIETAKAPVIMPVPTREHYDFDGWYLSPDCEGEKLPSVYEIITDTTVYAKWVLKDSVKAVFLETDGETEHGPLYYLGGEALTLPTPSKYGYAFLGWYDGDKKIEGTYIPESTVTLSAKWEKVTYVYVYYGLTSDYLRYEYKEGETFNLSSIDEKYTENVYLNGILCPFVGWKYENGNDFPESIKISDKELIVVAEYDKTRLPVRTRFDVLSNGSLVSNGKGIHRYLVAEDVVGTLSVDLTFVKGASGGVGVSFRQTLSGYDYPHESAGNEYIAAIIAPGSGLIQMSQVKGGKWSRIADVAFASTSSEWQKKFNSVSVGDTMTATITVKSYEEKFEIYIDGILEYTCNNKTLLLGFMGTGFGIRSTTSGTVFSNPQFSEDTDVTLPLDAPVACVPITREAV